MISRDQTVKLQRKIADIQNIAQLQKELVSQACLALEKLYSEKTTRVASIYKCFASDGAGEVP